ncbi:hypothetical protein P3T76_006405 [Phytophthora citrophthora]|uniref:Crinkler (CRN) family protein n=1 Tax=Phytophthora citrophthora TaxID=4793 RepID=A0AAD9LM32_9STRA|nr:hypothetical protein P3T76_006405 [Phytophthora citrophthora]
MFSSVKAGLVFFNHVKDKLGANRLIPINERIELLEEKFFVVGGSARMMFDDLTEVAMSQLDSSLDSVGDIVKCLARNVGHFSPPVVNQLFSWYPNHQFCCVGSSYVLRQISLRVGSENLHVISPYLASKRAKDKYKLEMWFFSSLVHGGVQCYEGGNFFESELWSACRLDDVDPKSDEPINSLGPRWFISRPWQSGGYDIVFIQPKELARSDSPSFKVDFCKTFLSRLVARQKNSLWIWSVEVFFVVPIDKMKGFIIPVEESEFRHAVESAVESKGVLMNISIRVVGIKYRLEKGVNEG